MGKLIQFDNILIKDTIIRTIKLNREAKSITVSYNDDGINEKTLYYKTLETAEKEYKRFIKEAGI